MVRFPSCARSFCRHLSRPTFVNFSGDTTATRRDTARTAFQISDWEANATTAWNWRTFWSIYLISHSILMVSVKNSQYLNSKIHPKPRPSAEFSQWRLHYPCKTAENSPSWPVLDKSRSRKCRDCRQLEIKWFISWLRSFINFSALNIHDFFKFFEAGFTAHFWIYI